MHICASSVCLLDSLELILQMGAGDWTQVFCKSNGYALNCWVICLVPSRISFFSYCPRTVQHRLLCGFPSLSSNSKHSPIELNLLRGWFVSHPPHSPVSHAVHITAFLKEEVRNMNCWAVLLCVCFKSDCVCLTQPWCKAQARSGPTLVCQPVLTTKGGRTGWYVKKKKFLIKTKMIV